MYNYRNALAWRGRNRQGTSNGIKKKKKKKSLSLLNRKGEIERESKGRLFSDSGFFKKGIYAKHGNFVVKLTTGREETFLTVLEISKSGWAAESKVQIMDHPTTTWVSPPPTTSTTTTPTPIWPLRPLLEMLDRPTSFTFDFDIVKIFIPLKTRFVLTNKRT